jgi:sugar/nucleoside kinase (ribokinase family)
VAMARAGLNAGLLTWLGDDRDGQACLQTWVDAGVDQRGVVVASGQASPRSLLFYDPDGGATCYYHPSGSAALRLTASGRDLLSGARALAVTVGPAALTEELLAARRPNQPLAWNVKADADAFPLDLRRRLLRESTIVCLNRDELPFVAAALTSSGSLIPSAPLYARGDENTTLATRQMAPPSRWERGWGEGEPRQRDAPLAESLPQETDIAVMTEAIQRDSGGIVVVTAGATGCLVAWSGGMSNVAAIPVQVADPTGAGDAFFGAFVAGWLRGADPPEAAALATAHAAAFLRERAAREDAG